jgi:two-component system LytT family response regulator
MENLKAVLIDDEAAANKVLSALLAAYDDLEIVGQYTNPDHALNEIERLNPDVVFLDIEMGPTNGIELANRLTRNHYFQLVFVTAFSKYAVHAFEVNAIDYLLKPVQKSRLDKTIAKLRSNRTSSGNGRLNSTESDRFLHVVSLDHLTIYNQNQKAMVWRTRKARELFFYLWLNSQSPVNKRTLIEHLFPDRDPDKAQVLLHTTVYQLRRCLADIGFPKAIKFANESYSLLVPVTSDVGKLEQILKQKRQDPASIADILELYNRDFLEEESYDWALELQRIIKRKTYRVLTLYAERELESYRFSTLLADCLEKIRQLDPTDEVTARLFLLYYGYQQRITDLKQYFTSYKKLLMQELELRPQAFLEEIYRDFTR